MRNFNTCESDSMAEKPETTLDRAQVKKAVQALQAFLKTKSSGEALLLDEKEPISLLFTFWKVPRSTQTIRIPLPHGQRTDTEEVCLFTKDEPKMTPEQTQRFYKKLLEERGVKNVSEIIPFTALKKEYKPYEAKRRLLGNFDLFLSDDRIRRLLPSHIGKHFYERKKTPLSVNLQSKHLARDIQRVINGTSLTVTKKGCCCMARIAHSDMTADEVTENIEAAVQMVLDKLKTKGPIMKLIHLKSQTSVALPIYTSDLSHLSVLEDAKRKKAPIKKEEKKNKAANKKEKDVTLTTKQQEEEEEEIPQLVPIQTPNKKPKLEKPTRKKPMQKAAKPAAVKKVSKAQSKPTKKAGKMGQRGGRKGLKRK
ncbi:ribosomal L1 domain-containing protein 1 [Cyprinodon tularosa]|uniref:ribosomal L1 domain-containing protein 1 n=1 Tax=Cyprinodon tularosa TaxID=77115 RepID=UPI0018E24F78|nr:ribosomal L1 domain-containing protein 1 [Cyprinodon tularosa]